MGRTIDTACTAESLPELARRAEFLLRSGRRATLIEMIGEMHKPYRVVTGVTLDPQVDRPVELTDRGFSFVTTASAIEHGFGTCGWATHAELQAALEEDRKNSWRHTAHTRVRITGHPDYSPTAEDMIRSIYHDRDGNVRSWTLAFDPDPLRTPLHVPYGNSDPDGEYALDFLGEHVTPQMRWASLRLAQTDGRPIEEQLAELDKEVRPWTA